MTSKSILYHQRRREDLEWDKVGQVQQAGRTGQNGRRSAIEQIPLRRHLRMMLGKATKLRSLALLSLS
jgi:hypothetical protein